MTHYLNDYNEWNGRSLCPTRRGTCIKKHGKDLCQSFKWCFTRLSAWAFFSFDSICSPDNVIFSHDFFYTVILMTLILWFPRLQSQQAWQLSSPSPKAESQQEWIVIYIFQNEQPHFDLSFFFPWFSEVFRCCALHMLQIFLIHVALPFKVSGGPKCGHRDNWLLILAHI